MSSENIIKSRALLPKSPLSNKQADEGGCGVVGCASSVPIAGKHFLTALDQMKNRGNGKGGGVALLGLDPDEWDISPSSLKECYIYQVAYLDISVKDQLEAEFIDPNFEVIHQHPVPTIDDFTTIGLEVRPPDVVQYFVKLRPEVLTEFKSELGIDKDLKIADEFIYQTTYRLNTKYYASLGEKQAFVLSHAKNLMVFKIVGYGDQVLRYYKLEDKTAHIWIGHHRYPTKGTVWHPGGAHPFIGLNEALVHNGDFSNYQAVSEYLAQRNIYPQFLTDTEVAALQFDLYSRVYEYPTEYLIEAIAPTTERDFSMLPVEKQEIYRRIQHTHIHGSPDGPWFFIVGRSMLWDDRIQLLGITDTSMLRPQVFAMYETDDISIGLIGSERQAIDATLRSLSDADPRFASKADIYWNARGGSYTDGGAFLFDIKLDGEPSLTCFDKFGNSISSPPKNSTISGDQLKSVLDARYRDLVSDTDLLILLSRLKDDQYNMELDLLEKIRLLTNILDRWHLLPNNHNGYLRSSVETTINDLFRSFPSIEESGDGRSVLVTSHTREALRSPQGDEEYLIVDISEFDVEGMASAANFIVDAYNLGWSHIYSFDWRGHRFAGVGLGPDSSGFRLDIYGNPGDYLGSGLDGAELHVHGSAQDQVGQMMKSGKLVIYGDVGQTFLYGAKGGEIFVLGNAAGRPLINAVGRPKLIINGTCLDYLAESFMAGDPLNGGGFAIVNGIRYDNSGKVTNLPTPYPGGNLFSLASGGAIYLYDPDRQIESNQLHGGAIVSMTPADVALVRLYLDTNNNLFSVTMGDDQDIRDNYVKIHPLKLKALSSH